MSTYLLTWNPKRWSWDTLAKDAASARNHGYLNHRWSCGSSKRLRAGDRVFLLRQGVEPRGILASGCVTSDGTFTAPHFADIGRVALYISARFDILFDPDHEQILPRYQLESGALASVNWDTQGSGMAIAPAAATELEELWKKFISQRGYSPVVLADEVPTAGRYWEGTVRRIEVNAYERDAKARSACIAHFGSACQACGFDFGVTYGDVGKGFIHVHHTRPLSQVHAGYAVNPKLDLIPVCPNCHAMLHRSSPPLTIVELQKLLHHTSDNI